MAGFCYNNDRTPQLGYISGVDTVMLPVWIRDASDLDRVDRMVRARNFGSIPYSAFFVRSWTYYVDFVSDSDLPKDDSNCRDVSLYFTGGYANTSAPTGGINRVGLGFI